MDSLHLHQFHIYENLKRISKEDLTHIYGGYTTETLSEEKRNLILAQKPPHCDMSWSILNITTVTSYTEDKSELVQAIHQYLVEMLFRLYFEKCANKIPAYDTYLYLEPNQDVKFYIFYKQRQTPSSS